MSAELSAYAAYKKEQPKNTKMSKRATLKKNNGANGVKRQNGVQSVKKGKVSNADNMCSRSDSSSCGDCGGSENDSSEQACGMDTTEQTFDSDEGDSDDDGGSCDDSGDCDGSEDGSDGSTDYYSDKDDDEDGSGCDDDDGSGCDDEDGSGCDDDDGSGDDDGSDEYGGSGNSNDDSALRSDQFSEEFTPNSSGTSGGSIKLPTPSPSPPPAPVQRKAAQKRRNIEADLDVNNNNDDDEDMPTTAKQQRKRAPSCPLPPRAGASNAKPTTESQQRQKAPSCPLPPRSKAAQARLASASAAVKSCPLPGNKMAAGPINSRPARRIIPVPITKEEGPAAGSRPARRSIPVPITEEEGAAAGPRRRNIPVPITEEGAATASRRSLKNEALAEAEPKQEVHLQNSIERGKRVLLWLLHPVTPDAFFSQYWEKNACQVQRKRPQYFSQFCSFKMIDEMLINNHIEFTTNIDVTSYVKGQRQTHNPDGRAMPPVVWGYYEEGCSIRILNPSTYFSGLRQVCTVMQEYFHCLVGANVYLTPPNSQGFAPHYDDIEAFVLQVEGRKRWRLYAPPLPSDMLARHSSGNYKQEQLGEPIFDAVLEPGDILYFPRGTVHQAVTEKGQHSLHITLSVYQQQSYANLIEKLMPTVMENAIKHHLSLRRGLPLHTWRHLGLAHGGQQTEKRKQLVGEVTRLVQQYLVPTATQIDAAVDQLAKRFQHEALPPVVLPEEKRRTVFGSRSQKDKNGHCLADYELTDQTKVRLLRANVLRLVAEENSLRVYYYVDNALEYCKYEANFMEIQPAEAAAVECLIKAYPNYVKIATLPLRNADRRVEVATALWERGLLMTEKPFK